MTKPLKLDPAKLDQLRLNWRSAMAAHSRAQDEISDLGKAKAALEYEIRRFAESVQQNFTSMGRSEFNGLVAANREKQAALSERIAEMRAQAEPLAERSQSLAALYRNCAKFVGGDVNA